jgi:hypothetical protein
MMSLLEKASIITTPTAYDDGKLLSVKPVQTFGSELVTNGTFDTDTDWSKGTNWTISGGSATSDGVNATSNLSQVITSFSGKTFLVEGNASNVSQGFAYVSLGGSDLQIVVNSSGAFKHYVTISSGNSTLFISARNNFIGSIDNVSVKEVTDADFDFTRGSSATRVNEQGLVQDVQILSDNLVQNGDFEEIGSEEVSNGDFEQIGSELVTNGDFATDSDWTKQIGWSISGGVAIGTNASSSYLYQGVGIQSNKTYKITFDLVSITNGSIVPVLNGTPNTIGDEVNSVGTYTQYLKAGSNANGNISIKAVSNFSGSIDNVSVKEVGQDWSFGTGWSMGDGKAICDGTQSTTSGLIQNNVFENNKKYKLTFDLTSNGQELKIWVNGSQYINSFYSSNTYTLYINTNTSGNVYFEATVNFIGSIDNISVKEVGQNWTFYNSDSNTNTRFEDNAAVLDATANQFTRFISSSSPMTIGNLYRVTYEVIETDNIPINIQYPITSIDSSLGAHSVEIIATNANIGFSTTSAGVVKIDNVSIIEITDDTDLPRINYTNFDYQDVLGDELVTNGDFSDGLNNWTDASNWWSVVNGQAYHPASTSMKQLYQDVSTEVNKKYKISVNVNIISGTPQVFWDKVSGQEGQNLAQGLNEIVVTTFKTNSNIYFGRVSPTNAEFYIDNVSVKELTEDVLVPYSGEGALLLEPQSTNLVTYSEQFDNAAWDANSDVLIESGYLAPDGTNNAYKITKNGVNSKVALFLGGTTPFTKSIYAKTVSGTGTAYFGEGSTTGNGVLSTVTTQWQRFEITVNDNNFYGVDFRGGSTLTEVLIFGAQMEEQSFSTSYIPTEGSTKTRLQDICNNAGSSDLINSTEGVLYAEISALADDLSSRIISLSDGTDTNRVNLFYFSQSNDLAVNYRVSGSTVVSFIADLTDITNFSKVAFKWESGNFKMYVDGTLIDEDTNTTMLPSDTLDVLSFSRGDGSLGFYGNVKTVAVFKEALSDTELACLTS